MYWRRNVSPVKYELVFYIPEDDILHSHRHEHLKPDIDASYANVGGKMSCCRIASLDLFSVFWASFTIQQGLEETYGNQIANIFVRGGGGAERTNKAETCFAPSGRRACSYIYKITFNWKWQNEMRAKKVSASCNLSARYIYTTFFTFKTHLSRHKSTKNTTP
jgi:hypothetical protein